jgi:hypothetical protein
VPYSPLHLEVLTINKTLNLAVCTRRAGYPFFGLWWAAVRVSGHGCTTRVHET